jgi:hypothetical protein
MRVTQSIFYHVDICDFFELLIILGRQCYLFIE